MSANLVVDVGGTCVAVPSLVSTFGPASGAVVGLPVDLKDANTLCNVFFAGGAASGPVALLIQTAEPGSGLIQSGGGYPISGNFTDPTSGLAQLPPGVSSGGIMWVNSGLVSLPGGGGASGQMGINTFPFGTSPVFNAQASPGYVASGNFPVFGSGGGMAFAAFQRPHRYARLLLQSGASAIPGVVAGFLSQLRTTGSGGGSTQSPQTGTVNV